MQVKYFLILMLLANTHVFAFEEEMPSLDFLEYLGELETEIDGELVSPTELELIAEINAGEDKDHE